MTPESAHRGRPAVLAVLPLKPFPAGKGRLDGLLGAEARAALAREVATRVAAACRAAGVTTATVTADGGVRRWAADLGLEVITEPPAGGLDAAAGAGAAEATRRGLAWCVVHADLPFLGPDDVSSVIAQTGPGRAVLAPSGDGGTNLLAGDGPFSFSYGPGSFARHLAALRSRQRRVVIRRGTSLDLDTPEDLRAAAGMPGGEWLRAYLT